MPARPTYRCKALTGNEVYYSITCFDKPGDRPVKYYKFHETETGHVHETPERMHQTGTSGSSALSILPNQSHWASQIFSLQKTHLYPSSNMEDRTLKN